VPILGISHLLVSARKLSFLKFQKTKEKKQIREKNLDELKIALKEARNILFTLKLDKAQNKLKNLRSIFMKRKEIARILTAITEKELYAKNA